MGEKIKQLMDKANLTAYRLSKETGIRETSISDWLSGKYNPKTDKLKILADYFGVSIEYFLN